MKYLLDNVDKGVLFSHNIVVMRKEEKTMTKKKKAKKLSKRKLEKKVKEKILDDCEKEGINRKELDKRLEVVF